MVKWLKDTFSSPFFVVNGKKSLTGTIVVLSCLVTLTLWVAASMKADVTFDSNFALIWNSACWALYTGKRVVDHRAEIAKK